MLPLIAGCTTPAPILRPVTAFAPVTCATTPELVTAISLVPDKDKQVWSLDQVVDGNTPCLATEESSGPYMVFALPEDRWMAPIEIGSVLEPARLFSPHVTILGDDGQEMRSFTPDQYNMRNHMNGRTYSVQFQPQDGERYVLVTTNPVRMGSALEGIATGTQTTTYYYGFGAANWTTGLESQIASGFSYEGTIRANVFRPEDDD